MYNNRALVPDHADYFARWDSRSRAARASLRCELDVAYGPGAMETLDIFPARASNAPVVVFIHGGYWRSLDKADHSFVAPALHELGAFLAQQPEVQDLQGICRHRVPDHFQRPGAPVLLAGTGGAR